MFNRACVLEPGAAPNGSVAIEPKRPPVKLYYRIGEVSEIVGVEPHVLRYWETEFRTIRPQKSRKGQRIYSRRDVDKLLRVKDLLYNQGYTIVGARKRLRDAVQAPSPEQAQAALATADERLASTPAAPSSSDPDGASRAPSAVEPALVAMTESLRALRVDVVGMLRELGEEV